MSQKNVTQTETIQKLRSDCKRLRAERNKLRDKQAQPAQPLILISDADAGADAAAVDVPWMMNFYE